MSADQDSPKDAEQAAQPGAAETGDPVPCSACRGTGEVSSNLGGTPTSVPCPWCEGGGMRLSDHDAQAGQIAAREAAGEAGDTGGGEPDPNQESAEPPDRVA